MNFKMKISKIPKEISQDLLKKIFKNLLKAIGIIIYFMILNLAYSSMKHERLLEDIKVFSGSFLLVGLLCMEKAYKSEKGELVILGIELLILSFHSLSIIHIITLFNYNFQYYLLTSSYIFAIYYVLKSIILYTKEKNEGAYYVSNLGKNLQGQSPVEGYGI